MVSASISRELTDEERQLIREIFPSIHWAFDDLVDIDGDFNDIDMETMR